MLPLVSRNRAIGALMLASRSRAAFTSEHSEAIQPLAEVLAFAFVTQHQFHALEKFETVEGLSETALGVASDINSALQAIVGEGALLQSQHPELAANVGPILEQAERIEGLVERMRTAARERHDRVGAAGAIPASPESISQDESFV